MPAPDVSDDHGLLCAAVREAGALARSMSGDVEHWKKDDGTPISHADLEVDTLLKTTLTSDRPDYGWLSEETRDDHARLERSRLWVVDPIDGTKAFLKGDPHWTVSAALVEDGRPVLAAVYNPITEEFFDVVVGAVARLNGSAIEASPRTELPGCRIIMHRSVVNSKKWTEPWPAMRMEMRNSMAYRLCLVACGAFDAVVTISSKSAWDLAGADLLVHEAGGAVSAHDGAPFIYNQPDHTCPNVLAAGPGLYDTLLERTKARRN
ncbi:MAG: 3'(2'),5'-bisphosphate nucleotidase CysQ [Hyphomicrobiales bacterium]